MGCGHSAYVEGQDPLPTANGSVLSVDVALGARTSGGLITSMFDLLQQDLAAIQEIHERWLNAELRGDHSQVIDLCTDDVSWIPPDSPPLSGKEAIASYLTENPVDLKDIQAKDLVIRGTGSVAYLTSSYHTWFKLPDDPKTQDAKSHESTGTHLWIVRKNESGAWRVAIVTWSCW